MCPRSSSFASPGWRSFRTCFWKLCRSSDSLFWIWWRCEQVKTQNGPIILERARFWSVEAAQPRFFVASPLDFSPSIWEILAIGHPCGWCPFTRLCGQCVSNPSSIPQLSHESFLIDQLLFVAWNLVWGSRRYYSPLREAILLRKPLSNHSPPSRWCMRSAGCLTDDLKSSSIWRVASQLVSEDSEDKHRNTISWRFLVSMDGQQYSFSIVFPFFLWHI